MGVVYNAAKNQFKVFIPRGNRQYKQFTYSVNRYGEFAEKLAQMSFENGIRYNDYYVIKDDVAIFKVFTKAYGIVEVFFDAEDVPKLISNKLSISNDNHAKTFYCKTTNGTGVHRIIVGVNDLLEIVDHIDRNGLNNKKINLRVVNTRTNNKNANTRIDNSTGVKGVTYETGKRYKAEWYDENGRRHSKSFSINKYGQKKALQMAKEHRRQQELLNNYTVASQERSETIESELNKSFKRVE